MVLGPQYNLNSAFCDVVGYAKNYHLYHHKPWRLPDHHRTKPKDCAKKLMADWNVLYSSSWASSTSSVSSYLSRPSPTQRSSG